MRDPAMKLVTIKNKYIFRPRTDKEAAKYKPNEAHIYAAYTDEETGETRLVQMTHLYEERKRIGIKQGYILPVKLPNVEFPSGTHDYYYSKDIDGKPIDLKKVKAKNLNSKSGKATYVRKPLADKIKAFAKKRRT